jgi:phospholipid transport system transporter-binding protein
MNTTIQENNDSQIVITGTLNFANTAKLQELGYSYIAKAAATKELTFDLQNTAAEDNSGLALLLAWQRHAHKLNKIVHFINLPKQLFDMARLCGIEKLLLIK